MTTRANLRRWVWLPLVFVIWVGYSLATGDSALAALGWAAATTALAAIVGFAFGAFRKT